MHQITERRSMSNTERETMPCLMTRMAGRKLTDKQIKSANRRRKKLLEWAISQGYDIQYNDDRTWTIKR